MVLWEFKIHLDVETAFVDYQASKISLPRLGLQSNFDKTQTFFTHYSVAFERLYLNVTEEQNKGFRLAANHLSYVLYVDMTASGKQARPDVMVVDLSRQDFGPAGARNNANNGQNL